MNKNVVMDGMETTQVVLISEYVWGIITGSVYLSKYSAIKPHS